jgi:signal transduction histidine kinase
MRETREVRGWLYPVFVWLILLAIVFVAEYAVMLALPWVLKDHSSRALEAALDAIVLTIILAPLLWWTIVRPLMEVIRLRAQFLTDLFDHIEQDRRQTAHELHDGVGQLLTLLISGLRSSSSSSLERGGRLHEFQRLAEDALTEVRRLSLGLRPSLLDDLGLGAALERMVEDVRTHHSIDITLDSATIATLPIPDETASTAFRIVQEALTNIIKHSRAKHASIRVRSASGNLHIEIGDDGCGIEPAVIRSPPAGHLGLRGMRERAILVGGKFNLISSPGHGTQISVAIPAKGAHSG